MNGVLAAHPFVSAIPFFFPTLIIVGVIGIVVWRDRHAEHPVEPPAGNTAERPAEVPPDDRTGPKEP